MRTKLCHLDKFAESIVSFDLYKSNIFSDNSNKKEEMIKILLKIINGELTKKQKQCLIFKYVDELSLKDIALKLNVSPPTVYRHIKKAENRLKKIFGYLFDMKEIDKKPVKKPKHKQKSYYFLQ